MAWLVRKSPVSRRGWALALVLLGAAVGLAACARWVVRPECKAAYDDCVDGCGARCGDMRDPSLTAGPELSDTWTQACGACEDACRATRDRCNL
jgi:hypothetical protein